MHTVLSSRYCPKCRLAHRVCICSAAPLEALWTAGKVLVLQHPYESRKALGTAKLLTLCLQRTTIVVGRRFKAGKCLLLDQVLAESERGLYPVYLLFPQKGAPVLSSRHREAFTVADDRLSLASSATTTGSLLKKTSDSQLTGAKPPSDVQHSSATPAYVLIVIDGTWQQGKEMFRDLTPRVAKPAGPAAVVQLAEQAPSECLLRKEPETGCITTAEAVASALCVLEGPDSLAPAAVLAPLKLMTDHQAKWNPAIRERLGGGQV